MTKESAAKADTFYRGIHHATMNRATDSGVRFEEAKDGYRAVHEESGKKAIADNAKDALNKVLALVKKSEDSEDGDGAEEGEGAGLIVVKEKYKKKYKPNGGNCGDKLAKALTAFRPSANSFEKVCRENKVAPSTWDNTKNKGLRWMALSNVLRHRVKRGEPVTINGETVKSL